MWPCNGERDDVCPLSAHEDEACLNVPTLRSHVGRRKEGGGQIKRFKKGGRELCNWAGEQGRCLMSGAEIIVRLSSGLADST